MPGNPKGFLALTLDNGTEIWLRADSIVRLSRATPRDPVKIHLFASALGPEKFGMYGGLAVRESVETIMRRMGEAEESWEDRPR